MIAPDYTPARLRMVRDEVRGKGVTDARVLAAMEAVPRHRFVPPELEGEAYGPSALPIGTGQTISAPQMVGLMTEALALTGSESVLEVGTGSGYQAAVLARIVSRVVSIERHLDLAEAARNRLAAIGVTGVTVVVGDGSQGYLPEAPYDRIVVTAAAPRVPPTLVDQLGPDGILVAPVGTRMEQTLLRVTRSGDRMREEALCQCVFVPLVGDDAFEEGS